MSLIRPKINIFYVVAGDKRSKIVIFLDFYEFGRVDLLMVKIKFRQQKWKMCDDNFVGDHVISISWKYEPNPTENKYTLRRCGWKKVRNHDLFGFLWIGRIDLLMVKIKFRPQKWKIGADNFARNHVISISWKYELHPTENKYILPKVAVYMYLGTSQK